MIAHVDYRERVHLVHIEMTADEFHETVEWLEMVDPHDAATKDWRKVHDELFPEGEEDDR